MKSFASEIFDETYNVLSIFRGDRSNKGHILGAPKGITVAERDLTPAMVSLMRIILHSAMMAGAQENPEVSYSIDLLFRVLLSR